MERAIARVDRMKQGNPLHDSTMVGAQASNDQLQKILSYIDIGKQEGAKVLIGGRPGQVGRGAGEGLLHAAHRAGGPQQDAGVPGRDLRAGTFGHPVQGR